MGHICSCRLVKVITITTLVFSVVPALFSKASASTVFSDVTFANPDWDLTVIKVGCQGSVVTAAQQTSGGNTGPCRIITNDVEHGCGQLPTLIGFHRNIAATYNPQSQGAISSLNYSEDAILFSSLYPGQGGGPALRQNSQIFIVSDLSAHESGWIHKVLTCLTQDDFQSFSNPSLHPDFSAQGTPIEFGFYRLNSMTGTAGYTTSAGIDNWRIEVNPAICPPTLTNLVLNPGFEAHSQCPDGFNCQLVRADHWNCPTSGTSDYYHTCGSNIVIVPYIWNGHYQPAHRGDAYAGFITYTSNQTAETVREYVQGTLASSLVAGQLYHVGFYVSLLDNSTTAIDKIGAYLSQGAVTVSTLYSLPLTPQIESQASNFLDDMNGWVRIEGTYQATGGEDHIIIGNFHPDATTGTEVLLPLTHQTYYLLDDVSVTADSTTGANKDFRNTTGQVADGVEITLAGKYDHIVQHFDGLYGNLFSAFAAVPSGSNTILRWSGGASIPANGITHVGFIVPGFDFQVLGVKWMSGATPIGCARQVDTNMQLYGAGSTHLTLGNRLVDCPPGPVYAGEFRVEYFTHTVPLDSMLVSVDRHALHIDVIDSPPLFLGNGDVVTLGVPPAPSWATHAVVVFKVSPSPNMDDPAATADFILAPILGGAITGVTSTSPARNRVEAARPTPTSRAATLTFRLPRSDRVTLEIFSVSGQRIRTLVRNKDFVAGSHDLTWDGRSDAGLLVSSGVYFARFSFPSSSAIQRVVLIR